MLRSLVRRLTPQSVLDWKKKREFLAIPPLQFNLDNLLPAKDVTLDRIFRNPDADRTWDASLPKLQLFDVPDGTTGGVNPGDRRAVFYLVYHFRPRSLLEIGTHIGASTVHIASALKRLGEAGGAPPAGMVSVDIEDLNDPNQKLWLKYGVKHSPKEMADRIGVGSLVEFVTRPSLDYMASCKRKFDFIFLDGDHIDKTVYQEVSAALNLLSPGGVILLHDYFPNMKPLWSNGVVLPGPVSATERIRREGARARVVPLGELPWPTKCNSNVTSLALLTKEVA